MNRHLTITTFNTQSTISLGEKIGKKTKPGDVIGLSGNLGTGKTYLTKGIVKGIGFKNIDKVKSPCFKIINEYASNISVLHLDLYRIKNENDLFSLGIEEVFVPDKITIIEWIERMNKHLPSDYLLIDIKKISSTKREIKIISHKDKYKRFLEI